MACGYHEDLDRQTHCSLFAVRNWSYVICDTLCEFYCVDRVPGLHAPADADVGQEPGVAPQEPVVVGAELDREWRNDDDLLQAEENGRLLNEYGVPKTKAQPAGHAVPLAGEGLAVKLGALRLGQPKQDLFGKEVIIRMTIVNFVKHWHTAVTFRRTVLVENTLVLVGVSKAFAAMVPLR